MSEPIATRVRKVIESCMYTREEAPNEDDVRANGVKVDGVIHQVYFHPERIKAAKAEIAELIAEMGPVFNKVPMGGASFLQLCFDKRGEQWGEHFDCEMLLSLAIATEQGGYCMPREIWSALPGGLPYVWLGEGVQNAPGSEALQ